MTRRATASTCASAIARTAGPETPQPKWALAGRLQVLKGEFKPEPAYVDEASAKPPLDAGPATAAGRHIAASTCSECHGADLSGGGDTPDLMMAAAYDLPDFRHLMRTGKAAGGRELRMMSGVARSRFSRFTDAEIDALHAYLKARAERKAG